MKYLKYLLGLIFLCLIGGFAFFASIDVQIPQEEIRITVPSEIYTQ